MFTLILLNTAIVVGNARFVTYISHSNVTFDEKVCNVTVNIDHPKNNPYAYRINADVHSFADAPTLFASFKIFLYEPSGKAKPLIQNTIDVCRLYERGSYREKLVVFFFDLMKESGRLAKKCPVKAVSLYYSRY